jgi:hypothetical protein
MHSLNGLNELHHDTHNIFSPLVLSTYHHIIVIGTEPGSTSACPDAGVSAATGADCGGRKSLTWGFVKWNSGGMGGNEDGK